MSLRTAIRVWLLAGGVILLPGIARSAPEDDRPFTVAALGGVRLLDEDLGFENDVSLGARVGLGVSERWSVLLDFVVTHPTRKATNAGSAVDALRALARFNVLTGSARPYLIAGAGGILFQFGDAPDAGRGAVTMGVGVDYRLAGKAMLFLEGSADAYQAEWITYSVTGSPIAFGPKEGQLLTSLSIGIGGEF